MVFIQATCVVSVRWGSGASMRFWWRNTTSCWRRPLGSLTSYFPCWIITQRRGPLLHSVSATLGWLPVSFLLGLCSPYRQMLQVAARLCRFQGIFVFSQHLMGFLYNIQKRRIWTSLQEPSKAQWAFSTSLWFFLNNHEKLSSDAANKCEVLNLQPSVDLFFSNFEYDFLSENDSNCNHLLIFYSACARLV